MAAERCDHPLPSTASLAAADAAQQSASPLALSHCGSNCNNTCTVYCFGPRRFTSRQSQPCGSLKSQLVIKYHGAERGHHNNTIQRAKLLVFA